MFWIIFCTCAFLFGVLFGFLIYYVRLNRHPSGILRVDRSFPDEPLTMFLELAQKGVSDLDKKRVITFKIIFDSYLKPDGDDKK